MRDVVSDDNDGVGENARGLMVNVRPQGAVNWDERLRRRKAGSFGYAT